MTKIEDITKAVAKLPPKELAKFRAWFEEFDAARFDAKIEKAAKGGGLDKIAEKALSDHRAGRTRQL
jgi:hypothetical protein